MKPIQQIKSKCEQYWNESNITNEEMHSILERIWEYATEIEQRCEKDAKLEDASSYLEDALVLIQHAIDELKTN